MKAILTEGIWGDTEELREKLKKGNIVKVHIAEYQKEDTQDAWYLINTGIEARGVYVSDRDVEAGSVIQTYRDPELGDYRNGPYQWISKNNAQIIKDTNESAKFLLQKYDWQL